jgi:hypothetical protein
MVMSNAANTNLSTGIMNSNPMRDIGPLVEANLTDPNGAQKLGEQYKVTQDLKYLMAATQVAELLKEANRQMTASMQQQPSTVVQDTEQLLRGETEKFANNGMPPQAPTQRDRVKQAGGALAQKQAQQQKNMQRAMQQGVGSQAAPNLNRMYDGGIVGYNVGGEISQEEIDEYRKKTYGARNLSDEEIRERLSTPRKPNMTAFEDAVFGKGPEPAKKAPVEIKEGDIRLPKTRFTEGDKPQGIAGLAGIKTPGADIDAAAMTPEQQEQFNKLKVPPAAKVADPTEPAPEKTGIAAVADPTGTDEMGKALREKIAALGEEGKEGAFQTGLTRAKTVMQDDDIRSEKDQARMDELYRKQEELEKKYTKSDAQTSLDRFIAGAAGMSGRGYTTAKGGAEALAEFEAAELKRDRDFLNDYKAIAEGDLQARDNIRDRLLASADKSESEQRADIRSAISAGASVYGTMSREDQEAANRENDIRIAEYNTKVQADVEKERNRIRQEGNDQNFKFQMAQLDRLSANDRRDAILERRMFVDNAMLDARNSVEEFIANDMNAKIIEEDMERLGIESIEDYRARLMEMRITRLSSYDEIVAANKAIKELENAPDEDFLGFANVTKSI